MTNEDAIKWLENLKQDIGQLRHEDLWPYTQAIDEIVALLKEQEAVKPVKEQIFSSIFGWVCGACGFPLLSDGYMCCPRCGKQVKWNEP